MRLLRECRTWVHNTSSVSQSVSYGIMSEVMLVPNSIFCFCTTNLLARPLRQANGHHMPN